MASLPSTTRAWTVARNGEPSSALHLSAQHALPPPPGASTDLVVRVTHAGLNPADLHFMRHLPSWLPFRRQPVPGLDFVGRVVQRGAAAPARVPLGAWVCGALPVSRVFWGAGSLAGYVAVAARDVAVVPKGLVEQDRAREAVGCGVVGQTAAIAIKAAAGEGAWKGRRVLINGCSGGVGVMLSQVLKARGATVVGVCSGANEQFVKGLGVDEVIDYTQHPDLYAHLATTHHDPPFDAILDCIGDDALFTRSTAYLAPAGRFVSIVGGASQGVYPMVMHQLRPRLLGGTPRSYQIMGLFPTGELAREVARWFDPDDEDAGVSGLRVPVDAEYAMDDAVAAYERLATKRARGKIVVRVEGGEGGAGAEGGSR